MVLLFVVCGWWEETVAGVFSTYVLGIFYIGIFLYESYDLGKIVKPSVIKYRAIILMFTVS